MVVIVVEVVVNVVDVTVIVVDVAVIIVVVVADITLSESQLPTPVYLNNDEWHILVLSANEMQFRREICCIDRMYQ